MAFQLKSFPSIVAGMINHMRGIQSQITDFNVGSVARTLLEAPAIEIDQLYQQMWNGLLEAIPVATFNSFNFAALQPTPASGIFTVDIAVQTTDTLIPGGTTFTAVGSSTSYVSESDVTITAGNTTAPVLAAASTTGSATNLPAGSSMSITPIPAGFISAINAAALANGTDLETDDQRLQRFQSYISTLSRATPLAIVYGAKTAQLLSADGLVLEQVKTAAVVEPWLTDSSQPIGLVNLYVHNGVGSTSGALVNQANTVVYGYTDSNGNKVPGWKAAGAKVVTAAASEVDIDVTAVLTALPSYDPTVLIPLVEAALSTYALGLDQGVSWQYDEAIVTAKSVPGVANFVLTAPAADVASTAAQKIMPGAYTVTHT
jgi:hypothetical protein